MSVDTALVVPSIRKDSFERFVREWAETGLFDRADLILMEDNPTKSFEIEEELQHHFDKYDIDLIPQSGRFIHLSWEDIDQHEWSHIIPRRSDTVRSFAYWWVWNQGDWVNGGYDYLMTMDDDCYPAKGYEQLDQMHKAMLTRTKWFNTLNSVRPRGTPYFNLGKREVHINHGLWQGVLDYDAPQQLANPIPEVFSHDNRIVPHGAYHSFCGMNAIWRREAIPLSYHMLMGKECTTAPVCDGAEHQLRALPFDRFGDIWCGIVQKKICDHLKWSVSSGTPYIHHDRASNPFTNLRKEANGIEVNEWFWEKIDGIGLGGCRSPSDCYHQIGLAVMKWDGEHSEYWKRLGAAMVTWAGLFGA